MTGRVRRVVADALLWLAMGGPKGALRALASRVDPTCEARRDAAHPPLQIPVEFYEEMQEQIVEAISRIPYKRFGIPGRPVESRPTGAIAASERTRAAEAYDAFLATLPPCCPVAIERARALRDPIERLSLGTALQDVGRTVVDPLLRAGFMFVRRDEGYWPPRQAPPTEER